MALVKPRNPFDFQAKVEKSACAAQLGVLSLGEDDDIAGVANHELDITKLRKVRVERMDASRAFRLRVDAACSGRRNHIASPCSRKLGLRAKDKSAASYDARHSVHGLVDSYKWTKVLRGQTRG